MQLESELQRLAGERMELLDRKTDIWWWRPKTELQTKRHINNHDFPDVPASLFSQIRKCFLE